MRFGVFLVPEPFPWSNRTLSYDLELEEIVKAEQLTSDEVWVGEHRALRRELAIDALGG